MDVNVRVIYDFEYTTKEGKDVKIREGEKLYLIKKTNDDWWQVIRTTGRPFYVPASYVTEIPNNNNKPVEDTSGEMRIQIEEDESNDKPSVSKRTEQTNFRKSASLINLVSEKLPDLKKGNECVTNEDTKVEGYSHVSVVGKNKLIINEEDIPLSSSLEQLTKQIQDKSSYLNSLGEKNSLKINDLFKNLRKESTVCTKNINYTKHNLKQINKEEESNDEDGKNKLHYKGSFKTKHERQKWAENYVALHTMGEENLTSSNEAVNEDKSEENRNQKSSSVENIENKFANSEKGSTDSLLDVDTQHSIQEGSICTTASDSLLQTSDTSDEEYAKILRERLQTSVSQTENEKKKPALSRNRRVESCRLRFPMRGISPPIPDTDQQPTRKLFAGWSEYTFADGRTFFYNSQTEEKSWKPPRRRCNTEETKSQAGKDGSTYTLYSDSSSPLLETEELQTTADKEVSNREGMDGNNVVPTGWRYHEDEVTGYSCYINVLTGARWFSSKDNEGRKYYFEENSNYSFWTLPAVDDALSAKNVTNALSDEDVSDPRIYTNLPILSTNSLVTSAIDTNVTDKKFFADRPTKAKSMIIVDVQKNEDQSPPISKNWPQLWDGHMCVLKEGPLNKTKITEHGKRVRKNWSSSHVVLTELFLLFFKDIKSFSALKTGGGRPELCVDLNGALIDRGDKISSRKNVYIISTVLGLQVLIQNDCTQQADLWLLAIQSAIKSLPSGFDSCPRLTRSTIPTQSPENELNKKYYKVTRTKSVKNKTKDGSVEDLTVSPAERQTKIRARLKKFFHRRPTVESLVKKGIWKDEAAFGCYLEQAAGSEVPRIPLFVQRCIGCIEKSEENMKTDGLYRASGNLSQVQKIRLQVDQNNLSIIEEEEDVHVLTGALKLFFRELKEPLIPFHVFHKAIKASNNHSKKEKISQFREIVKSLPTANHDTLKFLLQHLLRVTKYREFNRMHIPNVAIVFGPTLMWPEQESMNMALDLMQQNLVIECFLLEFDHIFK